eukprot:TRINITY_DN12706_c0_g4_i3.p1 TRINITY_DN12706_c0_g4~~TRINITY_DN12706_c0_g4_i3.p1  ORF type:complete len:499 (+),score=96.68 TRINITY_DN12706_c0_g4_i3:116-1498(+)
MEANESELCVRLREVRQVLEERPNILENEHHQKLKALYTMVPGVDFIPKRLWNKVNEMLLLKVIPKGRRLIKQTMMNPPCYVVLTGALELTLKNQDQATQLFPGDTCGDYHVFTDKYWKPATVTAMEESSVAEFSSDALQRLILEENSNAQFKALMAFLKDAIPRYEFLSRHSQERLARFFRERTFYPSQLLIKEGTPAVSAFLLKEGTCTIVSFNTPLISSKLHEATRTSLDISRSPLKLSNSKRLNGYMCKSTNMYQFNIATGKSWVGDDILFGIETYQYSVIAKTKVIGLEIIKENLAKLPPGLLEIITTNAKAKTAVYGQRKERLERSLTNIYNMNPKYTLKSNEKLVRAKSIQKTAASSVIKPLRKEPASVNARVNECFMSPIRQERKRMRIASLYKQHRQVKKLCPMFYQKSQIFEGKKHTLPMLPIEQSLLSVKVDLGNYKKVIRKKLSDNFC